MAEQLPDPIIVYGAPRSGTTYLQELLNAHPDVFVSHETRIFAWLHHALNEATQDRRYLVTHREEFGQHLRNRAPAGYNPRLLSVARPRGPVLGGQESAVRRSYRRGLPADNRRSLPGGVVRARHPRWTRRRQLAHPQAHRGGAALGLVRGRPLLLGRPRRPRLHFRPIAARPAATSSSATSAWSRTTSRPHGTCSHSSASISTRSRGVLPRPAGRSGRRSAVPHGALAGGAGRSDGPRLRARQTPAQPRADRHDLVHYGYETEDSLAAAKRNWKSRLAG